MRPAQQLKRAIRTLGEKRVVRRAVKDMAAPSAGAGRTITAIQDSLAGTVAASEKPWIERIEQLRRDLEASDATVKMTDFGAGSADNLVSEETARTGPTRDKRVSEMCVHASKSPFWALLLFRLIREHRPATGLELGTCLGISSAYQAAAMTLNGTGRFVTIEGSQALAEIAAANLKSLGLTNVAVLNGRFEDRLDEALRTLQPLEYAFIDGHHDEHATQVYFERLLPYCTGGAVLAFDDVDWSDGMARAWARVSRHPRVQHAVDLGRIGVCVLGDTAA
jgi:predicted O-methyltransferase YrrM